MRAGIYKSLDLMVRLTHHEHRYTGNLMGQKIPGIAYLIFPADANPFLLEHGLTFAIEKLK